MAGDEPVISPKDLKEIFTALPTAREALLQSVKNVRLKNAIDQLYRKGAKIGSGSSMDAFRLEGTHGEKLIGYRKNLIKIMKKENLTNYEKGIIKEILIDIQNALGGN